MAYRNRYGSTQLRKGQRDNLSIGWDNFINSAKNFAKSEYAHNRIPVLLFTPDMKWTQEHYHIALSKHQARELRNWLTAYLKDIE